MSNTSKVIWKCMDDRIPKSEPSLPESLDLRKGEYYEIASMGASKPLADAIRENALKYERNLVQQLNTFKKKGVKTIYDYHHGRCVAYDIADLVQEQFMQFRDQYLVKTHIEENYGIEVVSVWGDIVDPSGDLIINRIVQERELIACARGLELNAY